MKHIIFTVFFIGCAGAKTQKTILPKPSLFSQIDDIATVSEYIAPSTGMTATLLSGDTAPFDGILLDEEKAVGAADLRIAYDDLYRIALLQREASKIALDIADDELAKADADIDAKDAIVSELRDSWWARHKLSVGIAVGVALGVACSFTAGAVWGSMEEAR